MAYPESAQGPGPMLFTSTLRPLPLVPNLTHLPARNAVCGQIVLNSSSTIYELMEHGGDYDEKIDPWHGFGVGIGDRRRRSGFFGGR